MASTFLLTETVVSSNACLFDIVFYARERLLTPRVTALCALVGGIALLVETPLGWTGAVARVGIVGLLVLQFRLWDDLADREHDGMHHPERVLPRSTQLHCFHLLLATLIAVTLAWLAALDQGISRMIAYGGIAAMLALVYFLPLALPHGRFLRAQLVLLKYPCFILLPLASPGQRVPLAGAMACYLTLSLYDWMDNKAQEGRLRLAQACITTAVTIFIAWVITHD